MNEADKAARERAQAAVKDMTRFLRKKQIGLSPDGAFQRCAVHDAQLVTIIEILGELVPGGQAAVWDRITLHCSQSLDKWKAQQIEVATVLPS